ncbi:MAG TPA: MFS transporter [Euzebyales bacterium]|nr:MFS transporter [Euzebyales bacterium]
MRSFLESRPIPTAVVFTVIGVLPLYLTSAQAVRLQHDLGFGRTQFGLMVATFYLVSSLLSLWLGPRIDRLGPTAGFRAAALLSLASSLLIAVAARRWETFALFLGVAGMANAAGQLGSNLAVADAVRGARHGIAFAAKQAAVPTGAMIAGAVVPWVGGDLSWRWTYAGAAVVALLIALAVPHYPHAPPRGGRRAPLTMTAPLAVLMVAAALAGGAGNAVASFVVDAAVTTGFSEHAGARLLTIASLAAIVSRLTWGAVIDRRRSTGIMEATAVLVIATAGFVLLVVAGDTPVPFVIGTMLAFAGGWGWPGVMQFLTTRIIDMPAATSTGATLAGGYLGTVVIPPLFGATAERASYSAAFALLTGTVLVALAAVHLSRRLARAKRAVG